MKRVVLLTGSELRHDYVRIFLSQSKCFELVASYCEGLEKSLDTFVESGEAGDLQRQHLEQRRLSEESFFRSFVESGRDQSHPRRLKKGEINCGEYIREIEALKPDLLVAYGCSLIKGRLIEEFDGRFINVHLGLSPYYRGSGTNFWPFVNAEPEYVGATYMFMDAGVDTGKIIHQIRPDIQVDDDINTIGNRLILKMARVYRALIENFELLEEVEALSWDGKPKVYRKKDFTSASVAQMRQRFEGGLIKKYLSERKSREFATPIIENPRLVKIETDGQML